MVGQKIRYADTSGYKTIEDYKMDYAFNADKNIEMITKTLIGETRRELKKYPQFAQAVAEVIMSNSYRGWGYGGETPAEVVTYHNSKGIYKFSCWNPNDKKNYEAVTKTGSNSSIWQQSESIARSVYENFAEYFITGNIPETFITRGATHYYSPRSMKPKGSKPRWAKEKYRVKYLNERFLDELKTIQNKYYIPQDIGKFYKLW